jgi:hypothetical protein
MGMPIKIVEIKNEKRNIVTSFEFWIHFLTFGASLRAKHKIFNEHTLPQMARMHTDFISVISAISAWPKKLLFSKTP